MSDAVRAAARAARQLSAQARNAAELADQVAAAAGLAQGEDPGDATVAARRLLADARDAIESAQERVEQLDAALSQAGRMLPFLSEGWPSRRAWLQRAIDADAQDGLASWLADWFAAASGHRVNALRRLQDVDLPPGAAVLRERMSDATDALADDDWPRCQQVLRAGADGIDLGPRQVPDLPVHGHFEPDGTVREGLRLLAARLALHHGRAGDASAILARRGPWRHPAARDALRAAVARLRSRDRAPGDEGSDSATALLAQARESDPADPDVTAEAITQARGRADTISALDSARTAIRARAALYDASDDVGRLVAPPAELWIALAERAVDEEDAESAWLFLDRAADAAQPGDGETSAAIWELRADLAAPVTGAGRTVHAAARRAYFFAGRARTSARQLELARQDYEIAADGEVAGPQDGRIQAWARLSLADVIAEISRQRLSRMPEAELRRALELLDSGRGVAGVDSEEPWSYLTEADLRSQLSRVPGVTDWRKQEWAALHAAATAVSRVPGWADTWLALADAAMTCDLYWVAEAAAGQADEIAEATGSHRETARAGYIRALVNTGQYAKARDKLDQGDGADPWYQCMYGIIALRQGDADEAVRHFTSVTIAPTWYWAWHPYLCALALTKGIDAAQKESGEFMRTTAARAGDRPRLLAAVRHALFRHEPVEALQYAGELAAVVGPDDPRVLRAEGEALIVGKDPTGWRLIDQSLESDPRPTSIDEWEMEDRRVLALLAGDEATGPQPGRQLDAARNVHAMRYPNDPVAELQRAVEAAPGAEYVAQAADLAQEVLLTGRERARAAGKSAQPASEPARAAIPTMVLRLPAAWFAHDSAVGGAVGQAPELRGLHRELAGLLRAGGLKPRLVAAAELEPDEYQVLVDGKLRASGHVEPGLRYCPRETLSLLPEHVRTSTLVVATDHGVALPSGLLHAGPPHGKRGLGDLLTWSAAEVIAARYRDVAGEYRCQPSPASEPAAPRFLPPQRFSSLEPRQLSYRLWQLTSRPDKANWFTAERVRDTLTQEPAYFRWINRGRPLWDSLTDWYGAQRESDAGQFLPPDDFLDEELRRKAIEEAAYFRWIDRGQPAGDPLADWHEAERELGVG